MGQDYFTPDGCAGGNIAAAMMYTIDSPLVPYTDYPYSNQLDFTANPCTYDP